MTGPPVPGAGEEPPAVGAGHLLAGRYRVRELLGEGGMSRVYLADDGDLDRPVAVKVLRAEDSEDAEEVGRLRDEARAIAAIDHPGVVEVHDVGVTASGVFVVMAYVEGESLARRLDRTGPLPAPLVAAIGRAVCDALAAAHGARVVHRDVSPGNIILRPDGGVTLADFGIARRGAGAGRTRTGYIVGTPAYLAPEQARGHAVDGRADLYALGCCLFAALTGRPPFTRPDPLTVVLAQLREPPPRPSALRPGIPAGLDDVVLRALAKEPAHRFPDAGAMAAALARLEPPTGTLELAATTGHAAPRPSTPPGPAPPSVSVGSRAGRTDRPAPAVEQTLTQLDDTRDAGPGRHRLRTTVITVTALAVLAVLVVVATIGLV